MSSGMEKEYQGHGKEISLKSQDVFYVLHVNLIFKKIIFLKLTPKWRVQTVSSSELSKHNALQWEFHTLLTKTRQF